MNWVFRIFVGLYAVALALLAVSALGLFGQQEDPLSAVFLLPLGFPWNILGDRLGLPPTLCLILAPAINAALLWWLARRGARGTGIA